MSEWFSIVCTLNTMNILCIGRWPCSDDCDGGRNVLQMGIRRPLTACRQYWQLIFWNVGANVVENWGAISHYDCSGVQVEVAIIKLFAWTWFDPFADGYPSITFLSCNQWSASHTMTVSQCTDRWSPSKSMSHSLSIWRITTFASISNACDHCEHHLEQISISYYARQ